MSGDRLGVKFPDICLMGEEKPQKNLTQETCPDRESNPGPLRERRIRYPLLHNGGDNLQFYSYITLILIKQLNYSAYHNRPFHSYGYSYFFHEEDKPTHIIIGHSM